MTSNNGAIGQGDGSRTSNTIKRFVTGPRAKGRVANGEVTALQKKTVYRTGHKSDDRCYDVRVFFIVPVIVVASAPVFFYDRSYDFFYQGRPGPAGAV